MRFVETVWDDYQIIDLPFGPVPPRDLSRAQARQFFDWVMNSLEDRLEQLRGLVRSNGFPVETASSFRASVVDFVNLHAELDDTPIDIGYDLGEHASLLLPLLPIWQAVAFDVGLFLGSAMVEEVPAVRWELLTKGGKTLDGYHFPVLTGFERGRFPDFYISPLTGAQQDVGAAAEGKGMKPVEYMIDRWRRYV